MKCMAKTKVPIVAAIVFGLVSPFATSADTVRGGDVSNMHLWQGRAGGLVHSDRAALLDVPGAGEKVSIAYDKDLAQRTHMLREEVESSYLLVSFDKEVAQRTNMTRDAQDPQPVQAAAQ